MVHQEITICKVQRRFDGNTTAYDLLLQPNDGNVGIGTTSPSAKLEVNGSGVFTGIATPRIKATGNTATGYPGFMLSNTGQEYEIIVAGNDSDKFKIRSVTFCSRLAKY